MLVSFTMENFRAFRDEAVLDLRVPRHSPVGATPWNGSVQTVAAVYGANASGKSSLFLGLQRLQHLVATSFRSARVSAVPFALDTEATERPVHLSATFVAGNGVCYAYGVSIRDGVIAEEWAERYTTARPTLLFERSGHDFTYGAALSGPKRTVERATRPSTLFLSAAAALGLDDLMPLYRWFTETLACYSANGYHGFYGEVFEELDRDPEARARVLAMLRESDLGLREMQFERRRLSESEQRALHDQAMQVLSTEMLQDFEVPDEALEASFLHDSIDGEVALDFADESDGTKAMLCHAFVVDRALQLGQTVVFDEIDASLHPLLVTNVIRLFLDARRNPRQAQFVFTTHDVSLLEPTSPGGAAIAREQMWVTEKDRDGAATLTQVASYKPRKDENLRRRYLVGRFGGIPEATPFTRAGSREVELA